MPYIKQKDREELDKGYGLIPSEETGVSTALVPESPGEMNYLFTRIALIYAKTHGVNYQTINDVLGALEGAKNEFYRRVAVPYEDKKIKENGDVFDT
jgi:hypothetical protein